MLNTKVGNISIKDFARIEFLQSSFGNDVGDIVKVIEETDTEVYYNDSFHRYCYMNKSEEGVNYRYIPKGERSNKGKNISIKFICPQCQGQLTEVLDSDGGLFICRSDFHGKVCPSFTRETLENAYGVGSPDKALPVEEVRPTSQVANKCLNCAGDGYVTNALDGKMICVVCEGTGIC